MTEKIKIKPIVRVLTADQKAPGGSARKTKLEVTSEVATEDLADRLGLTAGSHVVRRRETLEFDGIIWSQQSSYYPVEFVYAGASDLLSPFNIEENAVEYLARTLDRRESSYNDLITVRIPEVEEAQFFKLPEYGSVQMFEIFRTAFDQHGKPMRLTITVCPTDRNHFAIDVAVPNSRI